MNSKLFISCITQKYCESKNCKNELEYAESNNKKIVVLMFERLAIKDIGGVGFMIGPMVRYNCYKTPDIFEHWNGNIFESFMQAVMGYLNRSIDFDQYVNYSFRKSYTCQIFNDLLALIICKN